MAAIAVTGGAACGKSTAAAILADRLGARWFNADAAVRRLMEEDETVRQEVAKLLGSSVFGNSKQERALLRERAFREPDFRAKLETVLHPRIRHEWVDGVKNAGGRGDEHFVAEIPLLYEKGLEKLFEVVVVVGTSEQYQRKRLEARGLSAATIDGLLASQWPLSEKLDRADHVLWNDGEEALLENQIERVIRHNAWHQCTMPEPTASEADIESTQSGNAPPSNEPSTEIRERADEEVPQPPREIFLNDLQALSFPEVMELAERENVRIGSAKTRRHLLLDITKAMIARRHRVIAEGIIEITPDHAAYLRSAQFNFASSVDDIQFPASLNRQLPIAPGLKAKVLLRLPRDRERSVMVEEVLEFEGVPLLEWQAPKYFDKLTPLFPKDRILLETKKNPSVSSRVVDLIAPLGKGQRGLVVAPPRVGKTILLKHIAKSIRVNHPEIHLIMLLIDERPEEVTDFHRELDTDIFSSTFDETPPRHIQVSELVLERAKRLVELGKDVVILLDSITRLARGYNNMQGGKGRIMSGGVESKALLKPKRFFGAARNVEEGGSLTILATALIETGSRMDDVIFEEFKGTGNMELHLDRAVVEKRIYPAVNINKSGTRKEELLYHPQEMQRITMLRRQLAALPMVEAMEELVSLVRGTASNAELLMRGLR